MKPHIKRIRDIFEQTLEKKNLAKRAFTLVELLVVPLSSRFLPLCSFRPSVQLKPERSKHTA
jgi:hypothetical protein